MTTSSRSVLASRPTDEPRAQPPIRWPRPSGPSTAYVALWVLGGIVAVLVPYFIVPPGQHTAPEARVWTAFACTVLGAVMMIVASALMWRRSKDAGLFVLGCVPALSTVIGGVVLATIKLTGLRTGTG